MLSDWRALLVLLIPVIVGIVLLIRSYMTSHDWRAEFNDFNPLEFILVFAINVGIVSLIWTSARNAQINSFQEQIGGYVSEKWSEHGSHEHSKEHCSGNGDSRRCWTEYWTDYHTDFNLSNNTGDWWDNGGNWYSKRVHRSSKDKFDAVAPQYWQDSYIGKPISFDHKYPNYIAAIRKESDLNTYQALSGLPLGDICSNYQVRLSTDTVQKAYALGFGETDGLVGEIESWNISPARMPEQNVDDYTIDQVPLYMDTMFGYLGTSVQADPYIYVVNSTDTRYSDLCMAKWRGGAKNAINVFIFGTSVDSGIFIPSDVVVKFGVDGKRKNSELDFENDSDRSNYYLAYDIREQLMNGFSEKGFNRETTLGIVLNNVNNTFVRQEMAYYASLKKQVMPSDGAMILNAIVSFVFSILSVGWFSNNDQ